MSDRQVRILHVLGTMNPGGVETWLLHVLKFIDRKRFQFDICTFGPETGLYASEVEKHGGRMVACPMGRNLWSFRNRFRGILHRGKYDIVHSHVTLFSGNVLRWARAGGVPVRIAHSHNSHDDRANTHVRRVYRRLMKRWISRYATHGLAASEPAASELFGTAWKTDRRFHVLYYGIDLGPFRRPTVRNGIRRELGIPADAIVVGHVGRFETQKNHHFLVEVAEEILKTRRDIHFLLIGDGPLRQDIEHRAERMGLGRKVHFAGVRTDVPRLMRDAMDLFLFPSLFEGLGLCLVEAQAAGLSSLVSDAVPVEVAILPQLVEFAPLSAGARFWASRLIGRLDVPRVDPTTATNEVERSRFSIEKSVRGLCGVYDSGQLDCATSFVD